MWISRTGFWVTFSLLFPTPAKEAHLLGPAVNRWFPLAPCHNVRHCQASIPGSPAMEGTKYATHKYGDTMLGCYGHT